MTPFSSLHAEYPPSAEREPYVPERHDAFAAKVPSELAREWRAFGFGAYGDGLFWLVPPDRPILDNQDWSFLDGTGIQVFRTAFGNVGVWQGGKFLWLNEHTGKVTAFNPNVDVLFNYTMTDPDTRDGILMKPLFLQARTKLGPIDKDECYGFAPLPALGGAIAPEYLIKTDLREYVALAGHVLKN